MEEIIHYLEQIETCWDFITSASEINVDANCVESLKQRIPLYSQRDKRHIEEKYPVARSIWPQLMSMTRLIPSISTLFEDLKYLEPLSAAMKLLIEREDQDKPQSRGTVRHEFAMIFTGSVYLESSEGSYTTLKGMSPEDLFEISFQQLWLYAMRHLHELVTFTPRKEKGRPTPRVQEPDIAVLSGFAALASKSGFESNAIEGIMGRDSTLLTARAFLLKARPSDTYQNEGADLDRRAGEVAAILRSIQKITHIPVALQHYQIDEADLTRRGG